MAGLIIFVEELGKKTAVELPPDATVADLAAAAGCSAKKLRFQGSGFADASQPLSDAGLSQECQVSVILQEPWQPKDKERMREAVNKLKRSQWRTTPEIERWMSKNHNGAGAPTSFEIEDWDVSAVTDMTRMFYDAKSFNSDISRWDVSAVTDMPSMFYGAKSFNGNISSWDVSSVTNMSSMFCDASSFNTDISRWNMSLVKLMSYMFYGARSFNSDISRWNVSSVTNMPSVFYGATSFNSNISRWDVSSVTNMSCMFYGAVSFNTNISSWNVSSEANVNSTFAGGCTLLSEYQPRPGSSRPRQAHRSYFHSSLHPSAAP